MLLQKTEPHTNVHVSLFDLTVYRGFPPLILYFVNDSSPSLERLLHKSYKETSSQTVKILIIISRMKKTGLLLLLLLMSSCQLRSTEDASTEPPPKAVYLTYRQGGFPSRDLKAHPEVIVVTTFNDFKYQATHQRIALWIDKSATPLNAEQEKWINEAPQAYYPIVLVGYSDTLYSFRDLLKLCCFMGPAINTNPEPGFSVIQWQKTPDPNGRTAVFLQGYPEKPTVSSILHITNALLDGNLQTIPPTPSLPAATATSVP